MEPLAWVDSRDKPEQAKRSTARLIVPRAPEVALDLSMDLKDAKVVSVEEYLQEHDYVVPADIGLTDGTCTVTPAGLRWLEASSAERSATNWLRELASKRPKKLNQPSPWKGKQARTLASKGHPVSGCSLL
jgi:hypothetical protein